ncbi:MAG: HEAT repeat domain-containing protein [Gammaproteobacteria bacterium]|nr:HEAT repeat domain-containing protein [Gammaproteobacteria bacterium]
MKPAHHLVLLLAFLLLNLASPAGMAASGDTLTDSASIRIELKDGLLTAEFDDAPLPQVLAEIGKVAGFKLVQVADFHDFPRISGSFEKRPVQEAVERLVANTNRIFFYSQGEGAEFQRMLSQLWLLGPGEAGDETTQHAEVVGDLQHEEPIVRSQAVLRLVQQADEEAVVEKLSVLLHTDPDSLVRSRVAIAFGALQDERAVAELESALQDTNFTVRTQSLTALGQIGGERATMALGNVLLNRSVDPVERVIAAQALWKQDSEIAQGYLQAGSNVANEHVRDASSQAPAVKVTPHAGSQSGPEATE